MSVQETGRRVVLPTALLSRAVAMQDRPWPLRVLVAVGATLRRCPWLLTAALCAVSVGIGLTGPDTPAQEYRVWLFKHAGAFLWDDQWYGGHTVPGYSLIVPPLGAVFGVEVLGSMACVASTVFVTRLLRGRHGSGHDLALLWFAAATVGNLVVGRLPFAVGTAFGALAVVGVRENRKRLAWSGAILASLASPLAGGFVLLVAAALARQLAIRRVLPLAGAFAGILVAVVFPERGVQPFPAQTFWALLALIAVGLMVAPREAVALRRGLMLWAAAAVVFFFVPTAIGGNIARPASLIAGPVAAMFLRSRPRVLLVVAIPLIGWQIGPVQGALASYGDPSASRGYYTGVLGYLDHGPVPLGRVEIPMTKTHWEARFAAARVPLARGWLRQLDMQYNSIFYRSDLTPAKYRDWLLKRGVRYVALPDVALDNSSIGEAKLLKGGLPYLRPAWQDAHWKVWIFTGAQGLVSGNADLTELGVSSVAVNFRKPGVATVLVHYNPYWRLDVGKACVFESTDGWTGILTEQAGPVRLTARLSVQGVLGRPRGVDCPADTRIH